MGAAPDRLGIRSMVRSEDWVRWEGGTVNNRAHDDRGIDSIFTFISGLAENGEHTTHTGKTDTSILSGYLVREKSSGSIDSSCSTDAW